MKRLYIPLPEAGAREQIMSSLLSQQKCSLSQQEISNIVQQTHGMTVKWLQYAAGACAARFDML